MAGSLIKVDEFTISSPVASVILGGGSSGSSGLNASIDSTYDVYMVKVNNWKTDTNDRRCLARVTESGTPNTTANYDYAGKGLRSDTTFTNRSGTNGTEFKFEYIGTADSQAQSNLTLFLFNFNSTTEYAFITNEMSNLDYLGNAFGTQGGQVFTSTGTARDGIQFFMSSSANTSAGTFTLYGLKK